MNKNNSSVIDISIVDIQIDFLNIFYIEDRIYTYVTVNKVYNGMQLHRIGAYVSYEYDV